MRHEELISVIEVQLPFPEGAIDSDMFAEVSDLIDYEKFRCAVGDATNGFHTGCFVAALWNFDTIADVEATIDRLKEIVQEAYKNVQKPPAKGHAPKP